MTDLVFTPAYQLAQMIRDRKVSAVEVLEAYLTQITKHNSKLNAICTLDEENARARARLADEALARVLMFHQFRLILPLASLCRNSKSLGLMNGWRFPLRSKFERQCRRSPKNFQ